MSDILGAVEEGIEEMFPPKPGGLVDKHRKRIALAESQEDQIRNESDRIEQVSAKAVKTAAQSPEVFSTNQVIIQPGQSQLILPLSPYRTRAYIRITGTSATAILAKDSSQALGQVGFPIAQTDQPLLITSRAQLWAYAPTTNSAPVVVNTISEHYAPEC